MQLHLAVIPAVLGIACGSANAESWTQQTTEQCGRESSQSSPHLSRVPDGLFQVGLVLPFSHGRAYSVAAPDFTLDGLKPRAQWTLGLGNFNAPPKESLGFFFFIFFFPCRRVAVFLAFLLQTPRFFFSSFVTSFDFCPPMIPIPLRKFTD